MNEHATCLQLVQAAGFETRATRAWTERAPLSLPRLSDLLQMLQHGTVRLAALIQSQPPDQAGAMLAEIERPLHPIGCRMARFEFRSRPSWPRPSSLDLRLGGQVTRGGADALNW